MMVPVEGSEYTVDADLVLIAAGFLGSQDYVTKAFGVEVNERTNVKTEAGKYSTNVKDVFTAGDMHRGQSLVVWAIREGREVAREVDESLMGYTNLYIQQKIKDHTVKQGIWKVYLRIKRTFQIFLLQKCYEKMKKVRKTIENIT